MLLAYVTFQYKEINGSLKADIYLNNKNKYICAFFESKIMICTALIEKIVQIHITFFCYKKDQLFASSRE